MTKMPLFWGEAIGLRGHKEIGMRAANTDLMQGFRYHVIASDGSATDPLQTTPADDRKDYEANAVAGFQSVTIPELSVEAAEYREGIFVWTQKYPGPPTVSELTLMRGITRRDTAFYDMVMAAINGDQYRADVTILHYQRAEMGKAVNASSERGIRRIYCGESFAIRAKPAGDLDSMAGDVSLAEMDMAVEKFFINFGV